MECWPWAAGLWLHLTADSNPVASREDGRSMLRAVQWRLDDCITDAEMAAMFDAWCGSAQLQQSSTVAAIFTLPQFVEELQRLGLGEEGAVRAMLAVAVVHLRRQLDLQFHWLTMAWHQSSERLFFLLDGQGLGFVSSLGAFRSFPRLARF